MFLPGMEGRMAAMLPVFFSLAERKANAAA